MAGIVMAMVKLLHLLTHHVCLRQRGWRERWCWQGRRLFVVIDGAVRRYRGGRRRSEGGTIARDTLTLTTIIIMTMAGTGTHSLVCVASDVSFLGRRPKGHRSEPGVTW